MRRLSKQARRELSADELRRAHRSIWRRLEELRDPGILAAGFGPKLSNDRRQSESGLVVRILVRSKQDVLPRRQIPTQFTIRLRRSDGKDHFYVNVSFPTDVEELGGKLRATGTQVRSNKVAATGLVLKWRHSDENELNRWGLLTVGHPFRSQQVPFRVQIRRLVDASGSPPYIGGVIHRRTIPRASHDCAVIEVDPNDLSFSGMLPDKTNRLGLRSLGELSLDATAHQKGKMFGDSPGSHRHFRVKTYYPKFEFPGLGLLSDVVEADAWAGDAIFARGTSGSIWSIQGEAAAIQVGAVDPGFSRGYAQAVNTALFDWAMDEINAKQIQPVGLF